MTYLSFGAYTLGLGHRRLSILDLSPAGHQPMVNPETGDQLIFNGEIYNFQRLRGELLECRQLFRGHSDTEVLLYGLSRWGPAFIPRLHGMFAFAYYDARRQSLLLARDSAGIKPLYVARTPDALIWASEVEAILQSGLLSRQLDPVGVAGMLAYGSVQAPQTIVRGVQSFPAGAWQLFTADDALDAPASTPTRFWSYPRQTVAMSEQEAAAAVRMTLDESVRDHLVADVPVGVFLSSGLDSTIVAGLAARHSPHIRSFTVGFEDQPDLSEAELAGESAKIFGLTHTNIDISASAALESVMEWLDALDQPSMDGLNVYLISKAVRAQGITVALSGLGGDELFGGYPSFGDVPRLSRMMRRLRFLPRSMRGAVGDLLGVGRPAPVRNKLHDMFRTDGSAVSLCLQRRRVMSSRLLGGLGIEPDRLGLTNHYLTTDAMVDLPNGADLICSISELESRFYQENVLLRDCDANGMAHSLEIRVPLLDQRMLDLVHRMPGSLRLPSGRPDKHLLRVAFPDLLRPALLKQAKRGFILPIRRWMTGPLKELSLSSLQALLSLGLLRKEGINAVWNAFMANPEDPIWSRVFTLVVLGHYVRRLRLTA